MRSFGWISKRVISLLKLFAENKIVWFKEGGQESWLNSSMLLVEKDIIHSTWF